MAISASTPAKSKKMTVASVLKRIETEGIRWIDLQFVDVLGALQHITIPSTSLGAEEFKRGVVAGHERQELPDSLQRRLLACAARRQPARLPQRGVPRPD